MAIQFIKNVISAGFNLAKLNENFTKIETSLQDGVSRSGQSPNQMEADLDLNNNDLLNAKDIDTTTLTVDGVLIDPATLKGDTGDTGPQGPPGLNGDGSGDLLADGTIPMTGNLDLGSNRIISLSNGILSSDSINKGQLDLKADQTVVDLKAPLASPTFTGTTSIVDATFTGDVVVPTADVSGEAVNKGQMDTADNLRLLATNDLSDITDAPTARSNLAVAPAKADVILQHRTTTGVDSGSTTTGTQERPINTITRGASLVTLASNKFKLLELGDWSISGFSNMFGTDEVTTWLWNDTSSTLEYLFSNGYGQLSTAVNIPINADFTVTNITHEYALIVQPSAARATNGFGVKGVTGLDNVFAELRLKKL